MRGGRDPLTDGERDSGLADEAEGFLLARAHHDQARREAEDLCARMPWLTTAQVEELTGHYVRRRLDVTRDLLLATASRAGKLRQEYEARYASLRRALLKRHAAGVCAVLVCLGGANALARLLTG
ncbi:hypothetical protein ACPCBX_06265 [Streptomyces tuirus]|uniref:Uncharacterized protein n=1 Tax=Streptomyces tuirus TaxID=68278 RepID=A0A7G1N7R4_9ACTN|nr:hypothetical protein [Streptomyces tuirus]BCL18262.1 hypothetical protein GCM10017668_01050 [Streptomyces tuirus]